jgi:hypothetical protein
MARHMWIDEGLYALLKSKADEWGYDTEQLLAVAAAYGLGDMILMRNHLAACRSVVAPTTLRRNSGACLPPWPHGHPLTAPSEPWRTSRASPMLVVARSPAS